MKKEFIFIVMLSLIFVLTLSIEQGLTRGKVEKVKVTDKVKEFFGEEILSIISSPDYVESYKVKPLVQKNKKEKNVLYKYPIVKKGPRLSKQQITYLTSILLNEKTYDFKYSKRGFLFPEYAFEFVKGSKKMLLFVCFNRNELMFYYNDKELIEDFDTALKKVKKLMDQLFD